MSAVAIPFDPVFDMAPRSAFTWPGPLYSTSATHNIFQTDIGSFLGGSDTRLTPPSEATSLASSPMGAPMTPGHQEMRRPKTRSRRDLKLTARMRRAESASYTTSPPPMGLTDVSAAIPLSLYSTEPSISLLPEPPSGLHAQSYFSSLNLPLQENSSSSQMFAPPPYQQPMPLAYSLSLDYPTLYTGPSELGTRSTSLPISHDDGLLYPMQTVPGENNASNAQESSHVRVVQSRPKPRCWEHGCNGRQFSTFSNLLRHQREKSGQAAKAACPNCGAEFTRTTARNGHLLYDKCKQRKTN
ncbi:uncharacterized protein UV8b_02595 [Ustilaginoidea virens]|uniref:Transcription factor c2h2 n=1 Tax=Ustilaginoidea virens TaxID=1159556 RepID=A0A8E5HN10_USTVR|nr:uncharacterized protein UV8b_02595 [Ustilaginoidea virens]QUC18354.1 hypothetical protein UV8b_02595 [Ustilaginoidea virens]